MRVLEAFAGCGGQALGWHRAGAEHVGFIERDPFAARVLARHFPGVPVLDDVLTINPDGWRGRVDVLTGGPPCQPASSAGQRKGTADERWLWGTFIDLAAAIEAPTVVAENPVGLFSVGNGDGFASILHAFGDHGYAVEWDTLAAGTLGAPHRRERVFIVARRYGWRTWARDGQQSMFPGRPGAWPWAGRWEGGMLTTRERAWPTPSPLPWEVAAEVEALPTPRAGGESSSRSAMVDAAPRTTGGPSSVGLRQAVELKAGILPPAFVDESELPPQARRMYAEGVRRRALPTPQAHDMKGAPGASAQDAGGFQSSLPAEVRRRALPTPTTRDHTDGTAEACSGVEVNALLGREIRARAAKDGGRLSPALPEWMMSFPPEWSLPDGPPLVDAPSRPMLPDMTAALGLTTEKEHRRDRLRCLGNACDVTVAEFIAREALS